MFNHIYVPNNNITIVRCPVYLRRLFDPDAGEAYRNLGLDDLNDAAAQAVNKLAAEESLVLLKNDGPLLPFATTKTVPANIVDTGAPTAAPPSALRSWAVIGPNANSTQALMGSYGMPLVRPYPSIFTALQQSVPTGATVAYAPGMVDNGRASPALAAAAVALAAKSDNVVLVLGLQTTNPAEVHC